MMQMRMTDAMTKFVPYLSEEQIERDAAALLAEYEQARGVVIAPPIPIEDIVEKHLKLGIEFDDTHQLFGVPRGPDLDPDILGAIFFDDARIVIDESLDPEEQPSKEGRYRFTLGHEGGGHWRLHRHLFPRDPAQARLFDVPAAPSVVCRSSQAKERVEWQADFYASCLLMPRIWCSRPGMRCSGRPQAARPLAARTAYQLPDYVRMRPRDTSDRRFRSRQDRRRMHWTTSPGRWPSSFLVSTIAMRIRLEKLGLLLREVPDQRMLAGDAKPFFEEIVKCQLDKSMNDRGAGRRV